MQLRAEVIPSLSLEVAEKKYTIEFPLPAVMEAEKELGRSLKYPTDWLGLEAKDVPAVLRAGLKRHHPTVTEADVAEVCNNLNPEAYADVIEALTTIAFPRFIAKYKENLEKTTTGKAESAVAL